jgi:hypothetical protein
MRFGLDAGCSNRAGRSLIRVDLGIGERAMRSAVSMDVKLTAVPPGSAAFTYQWEFGPEVIVPVGADGTATITLTPSTRTSRC